MNRRYNPPPSPHISEEDLILAIDRELPPKRLAEVLAHLEVCWSCRTASSNLEAGIRAFVTARNERILNQEPPTPAARSRFVAWVRQQATVASPRLSLTHSPWRRAALGYAMAFAALSAAVFVYMWSLPQVVSAKELIRQAAASETQRSGVQRVRIQTRQWDVVREIRLIRGRPILSSGSTFFPTGAMTFALNSAGFDSANPLSVSGFEQWHGRLRKGSDNVARAKTLVTLVTKTSGSPVRKTSLTLETPGFRPIEERITLEDGNEIVIREVSYQPLGEFAEVAADSARPHATPANTAPADPMKNPRPHPSPAELADAEVALRWELHRRQLDVGRDWQITRESSAVELSGWALSDAERKNLEEQLGPIPWARLKILLPKPVDLPLQSAIPAGDSPHRHNRAPLEAVLKKQIPASADRERYISDALASSQRLLGEAAALRELSQRYTDPEIALLSAPSLAFLQNMIRDHVAVLANDIPALAAISTLDGDYTKTIAPAPLACDDWRACCVSAFQAAQRTQERITWLLTESSETEEHAPALLAESRESLVQLSAAIKHLSDFDRQKATGK